MPSEGLIGHSRTLENYTGIFIPHKHTNTTWVCVFLTLGNVASVWVDFSCCVSVRAMAFGCGGKHMIRGAASCRRCRTGRRISFFFAESAAKYFPSTWKNLDSLQVARFFFRVWRIGCSCLVYTSRYDVCQHNRIFPSWKAVWNLSYLPLRPRYDVTNVKCLGGLNNSA